MLRKTADFVIVGGGVVGVNTAIVLKSRFPASSVMVLEKEKVAGMHGSGRNSGVLHAGFYYNPDSLKAKFCREGNAWLRDFCTTRKLRLNECGKLVVAQDPELLDTLRDLHTKGIANGCDVHLVSEAEARDLEPMVRTHEEALWSPLTASADPGEVMRALVEEARGIGVSVETGAPFLSARSEAGKATVETERGAVEAGHVVNCAGLYADRVASHFGVGAQYRMMPFKGIYLELDAARVPLKRHIYPTPNLKNPFLGVHLTVKVDGTPKIGPTAMPAFWREQYEGMAGWNLGEMVDILKDQASLFASNSFNFRSLAVAEILKYYRPNMLRDASKLANGVGLEHITRAGRPGIRAQLLNVETKQLVMDFLVSPGPASTHVLNAVSPGWTCARPFASHIVDEHILPAM